MESVKARPSFGGRVRVVSLLPGATEVLWGLGLRDELVGVSHACDHPPEVQGRPRVVHSALPPGLDSAAIDAAVRELQGAPRGMFRVDATLLKALRPEVVVTQALCEVCAASQPALDEAFAALGYAPRVVTLAPLDLRGVLDDLLRLGEATDRPKEAEALRAPLEARLRAVERAVAGRPRPRVAVLEWLDPPMQGGHWVPDMVRLAGGEDVLGEPGRHARRLRWEEVAEARPDVLVLAPCGFDAARAAREGRAMLRRPELQDLPAVRGGRVAAMDADAHVSRHGPRLVDGVEVLASLLHPGAVPERFPWGWLPVTPEG